MGYVKPQFDQDCYFIKVQSETFYHSRIFLIKNSLNWRWKGVLHEYLDSSEAKSLHSLSNLALKTYYTGCHARNPERLQGDVQILKEALKTEPDNGRYAFYLARSYVSAHDPTSALEWFEKRAQMGGDALEVFYSLVMIGVLQEQLHYPPKTFLNSYTKAAHFRPRRFEPLFYMAYYYRKQQEYLLGYLLSKYALELPLSCADMGIVEIWMKEYGLLMELSICAYYVGKYEESKAAIDQMLAQPNLPKEYRQYALNNLEWIIPKRNYSATPLLRERSGKVTGTVTFTKEKFEPVFLKRQASKIFIPH